MATAGYEKLEADRKCGCRSMIALGYAQMDLGIDKLHFEIGAGKENFEWV